MNYIAYKIEKNEEASERGGLHIHAPQPVDFYIWRVNRRKMVFGDWASSVVGYEIYENFPVEENVDLTIPQDMTFVWDCTSEHGCDPDVYSLHLNPYVSQEFKDQYEPSSTSLGTSMVSGDGDWDIGPFDYRKTKFNRIVLQIQDAVMTDWQNKCVGKLDLVTSHDQKEWVPLNFLEGPLIIDQHDIRMGDIYERTINPGKLRSYVTIRYRSDRRAAWGHKSTITLEA
jgi:hypothetical protein